VVTSVTGEQATQRQGVFAIEGEWAKTPDEVVPLACGSACNTDPLRGGFRVEI